MKKSDTKKFQLSRETLRDLQDSDSRKVVGGVVTGSCQSCPCSGTYTADC
jgi:hypothetical protein